MQFCVNKEYNGFVLKQSHAIKELQSTGYLFIHEKSGARLFYIDSKDDNKVFSVSFRTPAVNSYGTTHILEHSVLCGSDKYPLKEPFVELIKSSLNTFLNAMTFPDKTMYPVASKNHADFENLVDVYCDAVFNPNIRKSPYTFYQEGHHLHIENPEDDLKINGVVYNEMKGAFSDPQEVLMRVSMASLFPDTTYSNESGGDPDEIPNLTYEQYMDYYNTYYHPSNSYFYLYGDMDIEKYLEKFDREYLNGYDMKEINSLPALQKDFASSVDQEIYYSIDEGEDEEGKCFFSVNYKIGNAKDISLYYAFNVLVNILFNSDASVLKKALIEKDIADEINFEYVTDIREPFFSIIAKNAKKENYTLFINTIEETLRGIVKKGIEEDVILSSLNSFEFDLREADSGNFPKGLIYGIDLMQGWLYDEDAWMYLEYEKEIEKLKSCTSDFYTGLISKYLIENPHKSTIRLYPQVGLELKKQKALEKELAQRKASMTKEELAQLVETTRTLIRRQNAEDSEEAKKTVPVLSVSDIETRKTEPVFEKNSHKKANIYVHPDRTGGIVYVDMSFPLNVENEEEISAAELLSKVLGVYRTEKYTDIELNNEIGTYLGDIDAIVQTYQNIHDKNTFEKRFVFYAKALERNIDKVFSLSEEILLNTVLTDAKRIYKTVNEEMSKFRSRLLTASHLMVANRLNSFVTPRGMFNEYLMGEQYYSYLSKVKKAMDAGDNSVADTLKLLLKRIVSSADTDILITCEESFKDCARQKSAEFLNRLPDTQDKGSLCLSLRAGRREGIIIPAKVSYVGMGANFKDFGVEYDARMLVAKKYLTSVYLWDNVRVLGGAYGAFMSIDKSGTLNFVSYRDPKLAETLGVYRNMPQCLKNVNISKEDINKLIIGTISDVDSPVAVYNRGRRLLANVYKHDCWENQRKNREMILEATEKDVKGFSDVLREFLQNANTVVAGGEEILRQNQNEFDIIGSITH